jgi:hypothetical protein
MPSNKSRIITLVVYGLVVGGMFASHVEMLGAPRPWWTEWRPIFNIRVVGYKLDKEKDVMWLWVMRDGTPYAYEMPYPDNQDKREEIDNRWQNRHFSGDEFFLGEDGGVEALQAEPMPPKE